MPELVIYSSNLWQGNQLPCLNIHTYDITRKFDFFRYKVDRFIPNRSNFLSFIQKSCNTGINLIFDVYIPYEIMIYKI